VKSNFLFFVGLFSALLISWLGIVIGSNVQLGSLPPYDDGDGTTHPEWMPGVAAQGQLVYRDLGCIACHTQQVRRPSFGSDQARGWGDRQSVARDYIYQPAPQLGLQRVGPDLTNLGDRKPSAPDADDLLNLLYSGNEGMPSYRFLFEMRQIGAGAQPSEKALKLTGALKPKDGWEVVPTLRAESLVGYLVNLKTTYTYPEATPFTPPKPEGEAAKPAPAPAAAAPAAAAGSPSPAPSQGASAAAGSPAPAAASAPPAGPAAAPAPGGTPAAPASPAPAPSGSAAAPAASTTPAPSAAAGAATPAPSAAPAPGGSPTPAPSAAPAGGSAPAQAGATPAPSSAPAAAPSSPAAPAAGTSPAAGATPAPSGGAAATPSPTGTAAPAATGGTK
jgi:cytochrome c oxidase cbb3-type subunit 2